MTLNPKAILYNNLINLLPTKYRQRWAMDENEQQFTIIARRRAQQTEFSNDNHILIQMANDYYFLSLFHEAAIQLRPKKISGIWCQKIMSSPKDERCQWLRKKLRQSFKYLDKVKWVQLYTAAGIQNEISIDVSWLQSIKNLFSAYGIWKTIRSKDDLLQLSLQGTACGDLIYDTYLRYRVQPTVDLSDPFLWGLIADALDVQMAMRNALLSANVDTYLTGYTSYIQHGIPAREALRAGITVYSSGNLSQFFKKLSLDDNLHTASHWKYKELFESVNDKASKLSEANKMLSKRLRGGVDKATLYMAKSAFKDNDLTFPTGIEGVIFLHDFFDSPHCHRNMLFSDFIEWINFTLHVVQQNRLPFAVKPHPNQLPESAAIVEDLRKKYPDIIWLSPEMSNKTIFKSHIKCGVSVYGTILHELAYHKIVAISAGDHPHTAFDIACNPKSIAEYENYLCCYEDLAVSENFQNEVLAYYYMHNIFSKEDLDAVSINPNLRYINSVTSEGLREYVELLPRS